MHLRLNLHDYLFKSPLIVYFHKSEIPVDFTAQLSEVHTEEHKMALFCCEVNKDDVSVEWRKDGEPLTPSNKHVIETDGRRHSLAIKDVDQSDVAEYSIVVGDRNSSATLHLDGECSEEWWKEVVFV